MVSRSSRARLGWFGAIALAIATTVAFALVLVAGASHARAGAPLALGADGDAAEPDDTLEILDDPSAPGGAPIPSLSSLHGRVTLWARLTVIPDRDAPARWVVIPDRGWKRVELFDLPGAAPAVTGVDVPLAERAYAQGRAMLPLVITPGEPRRVLLRLEGDFDGWEPPAGFLDGVMSEARAAERDRFGHLVLGLYAGLLFAVTFVNLLFGRILRDRVYLDYVLYAIPYALIWVAHEWIGAELLWPGAPWIDNGMLFVTICAAIVMGNRFSIRFLDLGVEAPRLRQALIAIDVAVAAAVALAVAGWLRPVPPLLGVVAIATCVVYLVAGALLTWHARPHGRYFLAATGTLAVGTIVYSLGSLHVIPRSPLIDYSAQIASTFEMLLLALALADRVRTSEQRRRSAEAQLREGLESEVAQRTAELGAANRRLVEVNHALEALSQTDPLTGVGNRRRFELALADEWRRSIRDVAPLAAVIVDVDRFKSFNDEHGHQRGDECLRQVAAVLAAGARRAGDQIARYGGEEFVLILPGMSEDAAVAHANGLREAVAELDLRTQPGVHARVTVSIGVAAVAYATMEGDPEALIARADAALYLAKRGGRNRVARAPSAVSDDDPVAPAAATTAGTSR